MEDLSTQISRAWQDRVPLHDGTHVNAYRIFHGAHDGHEDLIIERFDQTAIISAYTPLTDLEEDEIRRSLLSLFKPHLILLKDRWRRDNSTASREGRVLHGILPKSSLKVMDSDMQFLVDPWNAQNTGLFLDARPARQWLKNHSRDHRILNLFAYTGSLGVAAAVGGARSVTHVDNQKGIHHRISENHALNQVPINGRDLIKNDCYQTLKMSRKKGWTYNGIILDPPPRVPRKSGRKTINQDYPTLARLALPCLERDGWLLCFFNRWDTSWSQMENEIKEAGIEKNLSLSVVWRGTSGIDFPEQDPDRKLRMTAFQ